MTTHTDGADPGPWRVGERSIRSIEDPTMRAYCTTLSRFASSLSTTELSLQDNDLGAYEEREQLVRSSATQRRQIEKARAEASAAEKDAAELRATHGLPEADFPSSGSIGFSAAAVELAPAVAALSRDRDALHEAGEQFERWAQHRDAHSRQLVIVASTAVGLAVAALTVFAGGGNTLAAALSPVSLIFLVLGTLVVAVAGVGVSVARQLPGVFTGPALARVFDAAGAAHLAARIVGPAALGIALTRIIAVAFM